MFTLENFAKILSLVGTSCGLFSRVPQVIKTYKTRSANDLSNQTMGLNIFANSCFLFYMIVNEQWFIMLNCISVITLEGSLMIMKYNFKDIKKSSSGISLVDLVKDEDEL